MQPRLIYLTLYVGKLGLEVQGSPLDKTVYNMITVFLMTKVNCVVLLICTYVYMLNICVNVKWKRDCHVINSLVSEWPSFERLWISLFIGWFTAAKQRRTASKGRLLATWLFIKSKQRLIEVSFFLRIKGWRFRESITWTVNAGTPLFCFALRAQSRFFYRNLSRNRRSWYI